MGMAERAKKNLKEIDALQALSLDDLPEGGLDNLWSRLKTIMAERPDPSQVMGSGSDRRADAQATLQRAEENAAQVTNAAFETMLAESEQELAGAKKIKAAAAQASQEAESAVAQANEFKTTARQRADEMLTEASTRVDAMLAEAQEKIQLIAANAEELDKSRVSDAKTEATAILAEAKVRADEVIGEAQFVAERDVEELKAEAIQEIKMVRDGIARMQLELEEELETQRILTQAARVSMVSEAVTVGAGAFVEKATANHSVATNGHQNGATAESEEVPSEQGDSTEQIDSSQIPDEPQA
jgi:hypothetical protein